jgi:hypothetical protein
MDLGGIVTYHVTHTVDSATGHRSSIGGWKAQKGVAEKRPPHLGGSDNDLRGNSASAATMVCRVTNTYWQIARL